jgi:heat shock protein HslJ
MKASVGFIFFMLFLAGIALVNLKGLENRSDTAINSVSEIVNTAWRPTHIGEMRLQPDSKMTLEFDSEESVVGHSGCNRFFGEYKLVDGALAIGPLGSTRMACPEPENSFEISFLDALQSARSISLAEKRLTMRDEKGLVVARYIATEKDDSQ